MNFKIKYTKRFEKGFKKLSKTEKEQTKNKLKILVSNPTHPSLRVKRLQGTKDLFECSVNMDIRIIWHYDGSNLILALDIGHHNILEKY